MKSFLGEIITELISTIIGLIIGGGAGYKIGINKQRHNINQRQKAGDGAIQTQIGEKK